MNDKDKSNLLGMLDFALRVNKRMADVSKDSFLYDLDLQDAVLYALGQLGEKTNGLSEDFIGANPSKVWYKLKGLRNRIFHSYEDINLNMIYEIIKTDIDKIIKLLKELSEQA